MDKTFDLHEINSILKNTDMYETLCTYCKFLADKYNQTLETKYIIKYNSLYPVLYNCLSNEKLVEFFNCFACSMHLYTIKDISENSITMNDI
jgi:hypothetical protein